MSGRALVDYGRLLDVLGVEAELIVRTAESASPELTVPARSGRTLGETVRHMGSVYRAVCAWIEQGARPTGWLTEPASAAEHGEFLRTGLRALLDVLAAHQPEEPCSTWWPADETYGFWRRRMAHETTVRRVDVQDAAGLRLTPVEDDVAVDGVDEALTLWFGHQLGLLGVSGNRVGTVAVRCGDRQWLATTTREGTEAQRVDAEAAVTADATVSGEPMWVYLWLWGRRPAWSTVVDVSGDDDAVAQLWALLRLTDQRS